MKQDKFLFTASDNIPFSEIEQHYGIVDSQIVVGANIFRDVFASFRDMFGGETKGYKKDIDKMRKVAFANIREQAKERGANAVISVKIDLDEISGAGKSMFMLNIYGSAVKLKNTTEQNEQDFDTIDEINIEDIQYHKQRNKIKQKIENAEDVAREIDWDAISEYDLWDKSIAFSVLSISRNLNRSLEKNISEIPISYLEEYISKNIHIPLSPYWRKLYQELEERNWFNYEILEELLTAEDHVKRFRALKLCTIKKDYYEKEDVSPLRNMGEFISSIFKKEVETKDVNKMMGTKKVFTCPYCLKDTNEDETCNCGQNYYGLSSDLNTPELIGKDLIETAEAIESAFDSTTD